MQNSFFGKTSEDVGKYTDVKILTQRKDIDRLTRKEQFKRWNIYNETLTTVLMEKTEVTLNKPKFTRTRQRQPGHFKQQDSKGVLSVINPVKFEKITNELRKRMLNTSIFLPKQHLEEVLTQYSLFLARGGFTLDFV